MRAAMWPLFAFGTVIVLAGVGACYDPPSEHYVPPVCPPPNRLTVNAAGADVSFTNDVVPIITFGCAVDTCHGSKGSGGLKLDDPEKSSNERAAAKIYPQLINQASEAHLTMKRVVAGEPENSFLMHKLDWDMCNFDTATCAHGDCGVGMPQDGEILTEAERNTVRKWIVQGAKQN
jgi:hypothetical protein